LLTDTLPKKNRRERLESRMDELEKFIDLIEKNPIIIISDNPYLFS
jgi:Calmodulin-binding